MARRTISIDEKIAKQQEAVDKAKAKYDAAVAELKELQDKKDDEKRKEVIDAIASSGKSMDEIMTFLNN